jgi:hypothetical protein
MNTAKVLLVAGMFSLASSFAFAGPGAQYYQQRRAERARPAPSAAAAATKAETPCCRVTTVERPIASHKVSYRTQKVTCSGCAKMAAGEKCPSS